MYDPCMDKEGHMYISTAKYQRWLHEMTAVYMKKDPKLDLTAARNMARTYLDQYFIVSDTAEELLQKGIIL